MLKVTLNNLIAHFTIKLICLIVVDITFDTRFHNALRKIEEKKDPLVNGQTDILNFVRVFHVHLDSL